MEPVNVCSYCLLSCWTSASCSAYVHWPPGICRCLFASKVISIAKVRLPFVIIILINCTDIAEWFLQCDLKI